MTWEIIWKKDFYIENNYQFDIFCISRLKFHWKSFCDSYGKCSSHKTDLRYYMKKNIIEEAHLTNSQGFLVISAENGHKIKLIWEITLKKDIYVYSIIILSLQFSQTKSETWVCLPKS